MKKNIFKLMSMTAIFGLLLTSCGKDDNNDDGSSTSETLSGAITGTVTLDASKEYVLSGTVTVEDGGTLNIPAGTTIKANKGFSNYLLVLQGGKLNINGTASKPVKMTANTTSGATAGYWGGLIINGKAKLSGNWAAGTPTGLPK